MCMLITKPNGHLFFAPIKKSILWDFRAARRKIYKKEIITVERIWLLVKKQKIVIRGKKSSKTLATYHSAT